MAIQRALMALPARTARILALRFGLRDGDEHTLKEVGKALYLSKERIRQIQAEGLAALRARLVGVL